ncbi:ATP-grasp domain-containing protein [Bremerella cremea]|uniref:ATP-grasp domain-containing protein n=1 Tax=Bremerella cremea TaxID=1031537 RepID=A0A368KRB7_9BACT|nr:RimK family protein [Bremerella cremea]RCS49425.1 ATP-grasp domain-containing protein [Bremerella cremea]
MAILIVTDQTDRWPSDDPAVTVVDPKAYITQPQYSEMRGAKVFNLCQTYRYQSVGYYVSLLAEARGHRPVPSVGAMQDWKTRSIIRLITEDLDDLIQKSLAPIKSNKFTLSIYFGKNMAKRYDTLAWRLFNLFQAPLLRAKFMLEKDRWQLTGVGGISAADVPEAHWPFIVETALEHFSKRRSVAKVKKTRFDMAILRNPDDPEPPSDEVALQKFAKAAAQQGVSTEYISRDDYGRLAEFDALFIRDTTAVNHYTYRFARRAAAEGLVVIDDPTSILLCTNKVYLAELLARHKIPVPRTVVVHRENADQMAETLGFPCVLKRPDSAFSRGVVKVKDREELDLKLKEFFADSELIIAQEFLPTDFDWRIGVFDRTPIYACKYYMARGHWQIIRHDQPNRGRYGKLETLPVELAPRKAVQVALKAANLIGDGLYGVDVKESDGKFYVIEVNDNPNINAGCEDAVLKEELYRRMVSIFVKRIEQKKAGVE